MVAAYLYAEKEGVVEAVVVGLDPHSKEELAIKGYVKVMMKFLVW